MKLIYGDGKIQTQQGVTADGLKCLALTETQHAHPVNSTPKKWNPVLNEDRITCLLVFKNIEGARTLQDELNELIAIWSREQAQVVESFEEPTP